MKQGAAGPTEQTSLLGCLRGGIHSQFHLRLVVPSLLYVPAPRTASVRLAWLRWGTG